MRTIWVATAALILVSWAVHAGEDGNGKVAVVNMDRLIKGHPDTAFAESVLKQQFEEFEAEQKNIQADGEKLKDEFDKIREQTEDKALSEAAREEKITLAKDKLRQLQEFDRRSRDKTLKRKQEISENELRLRKQIVGKIRDSLQKYGDKNGISLVLDSSALAAAGVETVIFASPKVDITDDVMKLIGGKDAKPDAKKDSKAEEKPKDAK